MPFAKGQANANPSGFNGKRMIGRPVINDLRQLMGNELECDEEKEISELEHRSFSMIETLAMVDNLTAHQRNES